jgi:hypothetical protein
MATVQQMSHNKINIFKTYSNHFLYTTPYFSFQNFITVIERLPATELVETRVQKGHALTFCFINKNGDNEIKK